VNDSKAAFLKEAALSRGDLTDAERRILNPLLPDRGERGPAVELHDVAPDRLLGDKGYDSDAIRDDLTKRGIEPVIPPRSNRKTPIEYDHALVTRAPMIWLSLNPSPASETSAFDKIRD
jgi:hypothetical protein